MTKLILPSTRDDRTTDCPYCHCFKAPSKHTDDECREVVLKRIRRARRELIDAEASAGRLDARCEQLEGE